MNVAPNGFRQTINLGNSIVGVSILTMPFCFRKCGILLSICLILLSGLLNRAGCHLLLRSATLHRKRSFEVLALESLGPFGKFMVEIGVLGFLLGTCVAYFVVIGDVAPVLVSELFDIPNGPHLRPFVMTFLGMFVVLPLGLLRHVESLSSFSTLSFILYAFLILKLFSESSTNMLTATRHEVTRKVVWWDMSGVLTNLPIFAMALSCQTQIFEIFDHRSLNFDDFTVVSKCNLIVRRAINLCSIVYISVGTFGYIAFHEESFGGNILVHLPESFSSTLAKIGFLITVLISLPLCLFPCRTSLHSLFIQKHQRSSLLSDHQTAAVYMTDFHFRFLTITLIVTTIGISIIVPHIELVLGLVGSTIGAIVCFILPGLIYTNFLKKDTTERLVARFVSYIGFFILISCTFTTLRDAQVIGSDDVIFMKPTVSLLVTQGPAMKQSSTPSPPHLATLKAVIEPLKAADEKKPPDPPAVIKSDQGEESVAQDHQPEAIGPAEAEASSRKKPILVALDPEKIKKQEQLLERLEKQQQEHKKLIEQQKDFLREIKKHEDDHVAKSNLTESELLNKQSEQSKIKAEQLVDQAISKSKVVKTETQERVAAKISNTSKSGENKPPKRESEM